MDAQGKYAGESEPLTNGVAFAIIPAALSEEQRTWLKRGAQMAASALAEKSPHGKETVLVVSEISFNPRDFQIEALACAVIGLVGEWLEAEVPTVPVSFDASTLGFNA